MSNHAAVKFHLIIYCVVVLWLMKQVQVCVGHSTGMRTLDFIILLPSTDLERHGHWA